MAMNKFTRMEAVLAVNTKMICYRGTVKCTIRIGLYPNKHVHPSRRRIPILESLGQRRGKQSFLLRSPVINQCPQARALAMGRVRLPSENPAFAGNMHTVTPPR
jgi:hypothetical protein